MPTIKFVDLFAGCGGLSLGFLQAGLSGVFAIERDEMAFRTLSTNLINTTRSEGSFEWPLWLSKKAWDIEDLLSQHRSELEELSGIVDVLCGGPPCQGFSFAGRRVEDDPRNQMFSKYVEVVSAIRPKVLILENVPGMKVAHSDGKPLVHSTQINIKARQSYYDKLVDSLDAIGYDVSAKLVNSSQFGVPQRRSRLIVIGSRKDLEIGKGGKCDRVFDLLEESRLKVLAELGITSEVSADEAISDLEISFGRLEPYLGASSRKGYLQQSYAGPRSNYQQLMHFGFVGQMNSMRLARHRPDVAARFKRIISECEKGTPMNQSNREKFGIKKQRIHPMSPSQPAPTITTLPDDILHYSEPRILTVRESARLQSFPDWFRFEGKYTTGGHRRKSECPRYTQVGNAVPPLLARIIGVTVRRLIEECGHLGSDRQMTVMETKLSDKIQTSSKQ